MADTTTKTRVRRLNGEKIRPSASTVPRSLTKQAARIALPNSVMLKPSSSITAYTTASDGGGAQERRHKTGEADDERFLPLEAKDRGIELGAGQEREHDRAGPGQERDPRRRCADPAEPEGDP